MIAEQERWFVGFEGTKGFHPMAGPFKEKSVANAVALLFVHTRLVANPFIVLPESEAIYQSPTATQSLIEQSK